MPDWNQVYLDRDIAEATAAEVLDGNAHYLPGSGEALDYACGLAANAVLLAKKGLTVTALDQSEVAIEKVNAYAKLHSLDIDACSHDLEKNPPDYNERFDVIVVSYFLHRDTLAKLYQYLKKGGLLFYQTFSGEQVDGQGPSNPDFRLARGELLQAFSQMQLLYYREDPCLHNASSLSCGQVQFVAIK